MGLFLFLCRGQASADPDGFIDCSTDQQNVVNTQFPLGVQAFLAASSYMNAGYANYKVTFETWFDAKDDPGRVALVRDNDSGSSPP